MPPNRRPPPPPRKPRPQGLGTAVLAAILGSLPKTGGSLADHTVVLAGEGPWGGGGAAGQQGGPRSWRRGARFSSEQRACALPLRLERLAFGSCPRPGPCPPTPPHPPTGDGATTSCIAELLAAAVAAQTGVTVLEARQNMWLVDAAGLVTRGRCAGGLGDWGMWARSPGAARARAAGPCCLEPPPLPPTLTHARNRLRRPRHPPASPARVTPGVTAARWRTTSCPTATPAPRRTAPTCSAPCSSSSPPCSSGARR
jgi:hypothetical protein